MTSEPQADRHVALEVRDVTLPKASRLALYLRGWATNRADYPAARLLELADLAEEVARELKTAAGPYRPDPPSDLPEGAVSYSIGWKMDTDVRASYADATPLEENMPTIDDYNSVAFEMAAERVSAYVLFYDADGNEVRDQ